MHAVLYCMVHKSPTGNACVVCAETSWNRPCFNCFCPAVIQKMRCYCQMKCELAPLDNKIGNPPYKIHNFGWKEGISNNDDNRIKAVDGNLTSHLDLKGISVTASESHRHTLRACTCCPCTLQTTQLAPQAPHTAFQAAFEGSHIMLIP